MPADSDQYEDTAAFEWTEKAFELLEDERLTATVTAGDGVFTVVTDGECPRCGHRLLDRQVGSAVTGLEVGVRNSAAHQESAPVVVVDVTCGCGHTHPDAPDNTTGCGVSFRIELVADENSP